ncbi:MAG: ATP-binding protein [Planctomycetaceae bacterium]|jgi:predicted ATP-dependent endonuclease of OLD family|nr:ATP-binding protein [Planctomycetaceae bacterium]
MQKIIIINFGSIKQVEFTIKDFMVFVGHSASGKSLIAKTIYFFSSLNDELDDIFYDNNNSIVRPPIDVFKEAIIEKFNSYWNSSIWQADTKISFFFDESKFLSLSFQDGTPNVTFSEDFIEAFNHHADLLTDNTVQENGKIELNADSHLMDAICRRFVLCNNPKDYEYFPAGRSIYNLFYKDLSSGLPLIKDFLLRHYIQTTNNTRREIIKNPIENYIKLVSEKYKPDDLPQSIGFGKKIYQFANQILKGHYCNENKKDYICTESGKKYPLDSLSAGQNEAIWTLYNILYFVLFNGAANIDTTFLVIEEPESHLSLEDQQNMILALTLFVKNNCNRLILTTHSTGIVKPLATLINIVTLFEKDWDLVPKKQRDIVLKFIDPELWLDIDDFECYYVDNGTVESMVNREKFGIDIEKMELAFS